MATTKKMIAKKVVAKKEAAPASSLTAEGVCIQVHFPE
jgi:hypothetical protein